MWKHRRWYASQRAQQRYDVLNLIQGQVFPSENCSDWTYDAGNVQTSVEPTAGLALEVEGLSTGLRMSDFSFVSPDATEPGASSIAAVVRSAQNVVFRRCKLEAGDGADGG